MPLALIGGRLYHVIDQWGPLYSQDPLRAILPPYAGLGLYGGIAGAVLGLCIYTRWKKIPLPIGLDVVMPARSSRRASRAGATSSTRSCTGHPRTCRGASPSTAPTASRRGSCPPDGTYDLTTGFQPLFFYESVLDILGGFIALFVSRRYLQRLQPGDLAAFWGIWYGLSRAGLETLRTDWDWKVGGVPTAIIIGVALAFDRRHLDHLQPPARQGAVPVLTALDARA